MPYAMSVTLFDADLNEVPVRRGDFVLGRYSCDDSERLSARAYAETLVRSLERGTSHAPAIAYADVVVEHHDAATWTVLDQHTESFEAWHFGFRSLS